MARVQLTDDAREDMRTLDGSARKAVIKALRKLETEPRRYGEPLDSLQSGDLTGFRKLVAGNDSYRIIYWFEDNAPNGVDLVVAWVIADSPDDRAYEVALQRLQVMKNQDVADDLESLLVGVWRGWATPR